MSNQNKQITLDAAKAAVEKWLKQYADEKPFSAVIGLDMDTEDYNYHWEIIEQACKTEFPALHVAVFSPHKGVLNLFFRDREQPDSFKLYFYNPDSSAGGLIEECPFTKKDAYCMIGNKDFMDVLADSRPLYLLGGKHFLKYLDGVGQAAFQNAVGVY